MANVKISDLTGVASASGTQEFEVNDSGTSKKVTGSQLATFIEGEVSSSPTLTGQVSLDNGTNTAPSLTNTGDTNTGLYFPSDDTVGLAAGGGLKLSANASGIDVTGTVTADGLTVAGITTVQDNDLRIDLTAAPSASGEVIGNLYFRSENSYGGRQNAGLIRSISASNWGVSREAAMEFHTTYNSTMNKRMRINNNGDISFYEDTGTTPKFFWDASAESLGIGTSSPSYALDIQDDDATRHLRVFRNASGTSAIMVQNADTGSGSNDGLQISVLNGGDAQVANLENTNLRFLTNAAERMRLDASGNLLVGKTAESGNTAGHFFSSTGYQRSTRNGGIQILNRISSDGAMIDFQRDGSAVGSIGSIGGAYLYLDTPNTGFLRVNGTSEYAWNATNFYSTTDGANDLGGSSVRFKDLYLSGGVYLGGTGSANKLDDYESGTFTPNLIGTGGAFSSATYGTQAGAYTKIGNTVTIHVNIAASVVNGGSGALAVGNLPFTIVGACGASLGYISGLNYDGGTYNQIGLYVGNSGGARLIFTRSGDNVAANEVLISEFTSIFNCVFTATYKTS